MTIPATSPDGSSVEHVIVHQTPDADETFGTIRESVSWVETVSQTLAAAASAFGTARDCNAVVGSQRGRDFIAFGAASAAATLIIQGSDDGVTWDTISETVGANLNAQFVARATEPVICRYMRSGLRNTSAGALTYARLRDMVTG